MTMITTGSIDDLLAEISKQLGTGYPSSVTDPAEITAFDPLTNFLRSGPFRKTFLFNCVGGDYEYDENMNIGEEVRMELNNDEVFTSVHNKASGTFGDAEQVYTGNGLFQTTDHEDSSGELKTFDGIAWTPEYEKGATFENTDSYTIHYWQTSTEYLVLQKGKWTGDGNFLFFVLMTITLK